MVDDAPQNSWLKLALQAAADAPTFGQAVSVFLQYLHNEMKHGGGTRSPETVTEAALDAAVDIAKAIQSTPSADVIEKPTAPATGGTAQPYATFARH